MKHSFSVRRSFGVALLPLVVGALAGTASPQYAQAQPVLANKEPASIADLVDEIMQSRARGDLNTALSASKRSVAQVERQDGQSGAIYAREEARLQAMLVIEQARKPCRSILTL